MTRLVLPLTVRCAEGDVDLVLHAAGPLPWERAHRDVLAALGLPPGTPLYLGVGPVEPGWPVGVPPLVAGCLLGIAPATALPDDPLVVLAVVAGPDAGHRLALPDRPITVGRDPRADLTLTDPQVSFRHALLRPTPTGLAVTDLGSTNGVLVDGSPAADAAPAGTGSLIRLGGTLLQIQLAAEPAGTLNPDGAGHLIRSSPAVGPATGPTPLPDPPGPSPRRPRRPLPLLSALVGAGVGGALALVLGSPVYLAFAALGPVTMLASAVSDRVGGRRSHRRRVAEHRAAVAGYDAAIATLVATDRRRAWQIWPDPATLARRVLAGSPRLWDRRPGDAAYLRIAVGSGTRPLGAPAARPAAVATAVPAGEPPPDVPVTDVPVTVDLREAPVIGLVGAGGRALARWLIAQLAALHSPADLALVLVGPGPDLRPCRDLPHVPGPPGSEHHPAGAVGGPPVVGDLGAVGARDLVVVLDGRPALRSPLAGALLATAPGGREPVDAGRPRPAAPAGGPARPDRPTDGAGPEASRRPAVLCLADDRVDLPTGCPALTPPRSAVPGVPGLVDCSGVDADLLEQVCRGLAPLRDGSRTAGWPAHLPLTDLVGAVDAVALDGRWRRPVLRAAVGAGPDGPATFDLDADGPHLLIAGTTGSGKSELLLTLVAALAIAAPPEAVSFLLVDYKGGSAFAAVSELPHVVGVVTDLDPALSARALTSLRAELRRRERAAAEGLPSPPRLVLVVDEFATLAAELPEFLAGVLDIAQRGRSLGLHLVLATQRPAGVVSPAVRANIGARICLRVTDAADSLDVVGVPDAAGISPRTPGRALLRTGSGLLLFQSALVTAPLPPALRVVRRDPPAGDPATATRAGETTGTADTVTAIVTATRRAARDRPAPGRPWVPPLPSRFRPDPAAGCLALADLPDEQTRRELPLPDASILVTGPAGSGRSTTLRRAAVISAGRGAELLVVDAAGGLADLRDWPQVSSHLGLDDPRLVLRLVTLLGDPAGSPAAGRRRLLLVDGYDLVAAALDRADHVTGSSALTEVIARSAGSVLLVASGPPSLAGQRLVAGFPAVIDLDPGPDRRLPGRGRWAGTLIQIADAPPGSRPDAAHPRWHDRLVVRPLPRIVPVGDLPAPRPAAVPLGAGGDAAGPVTVDLTGPGGAIVVAGPRRSGVSTTLEVLAAGAARAGIPVLRADPAPVRTGQRAHDAPGVTRIDPRDGPDRLRAALAAHTGPLLLVVDQCGHGEELPAADLLERFCRVCGPGQHLLLGERPDMLARAHRGHLRAALAFRRGVLLAPDAADGPLLDVPVLRRTGPVPPGRGVWAEAGRGTPVQVACPR